MGGEIGGGRLSKMVGGWPQKQMADGPVEIVLTSFILINSNNKCWFLFFSKQPYSGSTLYLLHLCCSSFV